MNSLTRTLLLVAAGATLLSGCDGDDDPVSPGTPAPGTIQVSVRDRAGSAVSGATVRTNPQVGGGNTDAFGQILIPNVAAGVYMVVATHTTDGSAQSAVQVDAGQLEQLILTLDPAIRLAPQVDILQPVFFSEFSYVDSVSLVASVMDVEDAAPSLDLEWRSNVDGILATSPADAKGMTSVRHAPLTLGTHWISLRAEDTDGYVGSDSVRVVVRSFPPQVVITQPAVGTTFVPGEAVTFHATVSDRETPVTQLSVEWRSDLDGLLNQDSPAADGTATFTTSTLSRGVHTVTLSVGDADQNTVAHARTVANDAPQRVLLTAIEKDASSLILRWTPPDEPGFAAYRIQRATAAAGPFTVIDLLSDPGADQYRDQTVTLGQTYWYRVDLVTAGGSASQSNVLSGSAGVFIAVDTQVEAMIVDPSRPFLYAVDRVNNSLLFIDTDSLEVVKTIFIGSSPSDLDIDAAGNELFVANYGGSEIAVVDLATQTKSRSLLVDTGGSWDGNPYRLVCATPGRLVWTSLDQWNSLRLIDSQSGALLHQTGSVYYPDLVASNDGSRIYVGESGSSGSKIYRFDIAGNQLVQVDQTPGYGYGYSTRLVTLSGDGAYAFYAGKKILSSNLGSELGTFSENIYAANQAGTVAVGQSKLFDATTFAVLRNLPIAGTVKTVAPDGLTLYSYDTTSSRIYVVDISPGGAPRLP